MVVMMFTPIERGSAVDACADALRRAILQGELAPGDRLPPERVLAESFGVNRVTVRSALARLASSKLVNARQGSGYVVRDFRRSGGPDLLVGLAQLAGDGASASGALGEVVADLLHVRRHLARAVLERLCQSTPEARATVADAVARFAELADEPSTDLEVIVAADLDVLAAMLEATSSSVLQLCMNPVLAVVTAMPRLRQAMYREPKTNALAYQLLLAWIEQPDLHGLDLIIDELARRDAATLNYLETR